MAKEIKLTLSVTVTDAGIQYGIDSNTDLTTTGAVAMAGLTHCLSKAGMPDTDIAEVYQTTAKALLEKTKGINNKEDNENGNED